MNTIGNILIFIMLCIFVVLLMITKDEEKGCDFDCDSCPFPKCNEEEKQRKINDIYNRRHPR